MSYHTRLPQRGIIAITGDDCVSFLQGIVSNDVEKITDAHVGYGAFLTPQGKYLYDFFMVRRGQTILLDTERDRIAAFIKRLSMYKLRADVHIEDASDHHTVSVIFGDNALAQMHLDAVPGMAVPMDAGIAYVDPRLTDAGVRMILPEDSSADLSLLSSEPVEPLVYDAHRISLGLPDGSRDLMPEKSVLLENGFDELNGVDWNKGCYMGQEVTARTKHRGLVKKRLMPVDIDGTAPDAGTPVMAGEREAGEMHSSSGSIGLAMIKLDYVNSETVLQAGSSTLIPRKPSWATY